MASKETGLLKQWPSQGPPLEWKTNGAGQGYSSMAVSEGRLFTMGARGEREFIIAFDVKSGKPLWVTAHGGRFKNDRGDGPRGTPTIEGDRLYALGGNGDLSCLEARTGKSIWTVNVLEKFGGSNAHWGLSESPLIVGERILVNAGGPNASIVALNKKDGSVIWKSQSDKAGILRPCRSILAGYPRPFSLYGKPHFGRRRSRWALALGLFSGVQRHS
jgi:outer membrane protein assembly factor BamB